MPVAVYACVTLMPPFCVLPSPKSQYQLLYTPKEVLVKVIAWFLQTVSPVFFTNKALGDFVKQNSCVNTLKQLLSLLNMITFMVPSVPLLQVQSIFDSHVVRVVSIFPSMVPPVTFHT